MPDYSKLKPVIIMWRGNHADFNSERKVYLKEETITTIYAYMNEWAEANIHDRDAIPFPKTHWVIKGEFKPNETMPLPVYTRPEPETPRKLESIILKQPKT